MTEFEGVHHPAEEIPDEPGMKATPLTIEVPASFAEREYERLMDDYLTFTPTEAAAMLAALQSAIAQRDKWLADNPNGIADLQAKEDAAEEAEWSGPGWWYENSGGSGWCPGFPENGVDGDMGLLQVQIDRANAGNGVARFVPDGATDPDVQALRRRS